jgi:trigger factor
MIEKMYGKGFFYEEAINDLLPDAYEAALKESALDAVSQPEIDIKTIDENGVVITAKIFVKPEVKIGEYKGIAAVREAVTVTDAAIDAEIEKAREGQAREIEVTDRACENGDEVVFDFDGYVDGVAFAGGKSENYELKLGSGAFIPGFEEQIVGKAIGENFDVNVTFPADYHAEELAGKEAVFKCLVHAIKVRELPEVDDEFVKDVSAFDTLAEYRADIAAKLQAEADRAEDAKVDAQVMDKLVATLEADIPAVMIDSEVDAMVRDYETRLRYQGLDLDMFMKYTGQTIETMKEQFRAQAETQVKTRLALEAVAKAENIEITEEQIAEEYQRIADAYSMPLEQVKALVETDGIVADLKVKAAMDLVKEKAVIR